MDLSMLKSKTVWGGLLYAVSKIMLFIPEAAPFSPVVEALAATLGAVGVKASLNRITKDVEPTPGPINLG